MSQHLYLNVTATRLPHGARDTDHAGRNLDAPETLALAQLVKRLGFSDCRANAETEAEAYLMMDALAKLQSVLDEAGVSPR